jgi:hypothetical protein
MQDPSCDLTPDGTYVFERQRADGRRDVVTVLPEDVDEIAGPASPSPLEAEEKQRRYRVARLLADAEFASSADGDAGAPARDA